MFAGHQLVEAFVWWGLQGYLSDTVAAIATWLYLLFAFVVLPVYVPVAVRRRRGRSGQPSRLRSALRT